MLAAKPGDESGSWLVAVVLSRPGLTGIALAVTERVRRAALVAVVLSRPGLNGMTPAVIERVRRAARVVGIRRRLGIGDHERLVHEFTVASTVHLPVQVRGHRVQGVILAGTVSVGSLLVLCLVAKETLPEQPLLD